MLRCWCFLWDLKEQLKILSLFSTHYFPFINREWAIVCPFLHYVHMLYTCPLLWYDVHVCLCAMVLVMTLQWPTAECGAGQEADGDRGGEAAAEVWQVWPAGRGAAEDWLRERCRGTYRHTCCTGNLCNIQCNMYFLEQFWVNRTAVFFPRTLPYPHISHNQALADCGIYVGWKQLFSVYTQGQTIKRTGRE